ncbi:MAG: hypothetical protein AAGA81_15580 [Acidobacteriota bacterium]
MKHFRILLFLVALAASLAAPSSAQIRRDPSGVNVNSQGATTVFISFGGLRDQVPVEATWCGELVPAAPAVGFRCAPGTIFGRLPIRFDQSRTEGSLFTDVMSIPPSVARRAYQAAAEGDESTFFYVRRFSSLVGGPDEYVFVTCRLTGGGARVPLALLDVQLESPTRDNVLQVSPGATPEEISARIAYNGTGRLRGRWEVVLPGEEPPTSQDLLTEATLPASERGLQRRYTQVSRFDVFLPPTGRFTLPGPPVERLPTEVEGLYQVLLRVEASDDKEANSNLGNVGGTGIVRSGAVAGFPMPTLRYVVGGAGAATSYAPGLSLLAPQADATPGPGALDFSWTQARDAALYRLELQTANGDEIHQALLQQGIGVYRAPSWLAERAGGVGLRWRVVALDAEGGTAGQTAWRTLRLD